MADNHRIYLAIFLVSAATLSFEITMTRYYAVVQWHHLAYMVVSIALLGFGVSGTVMSVAPSLLRQDLYKSLGRCSLLFSLALFAGFVLINQVSVDPYQILWGGKQVVHLMLHYLFLSVPYIFSGLIVGIPIAKKPESSPFFYSSSMVGAAFGCLIPFLLFNYVSLRGVVYASILVGLASAIFLSYQVRRTIAYAVFFGVASYAILFHPYMELNISPYKSLPRLMHYPDSRIIDSIWSLDARVDAVEAEGLRYAPGLSTVFDGGLPRQVGILVDAGNIMALTEPGGDVRFLDFLPSSLPYHLLKNPNVLVLQGGLGVDLAMASYYNSSSITVLEKNKVLYDLIKGSFPEFLGRYVRVFIKDERNFLKGDDGEYDIIVLPLNMGQIASTSGVYSQSESYAYTVEAFREYIEHLSNQGVLASTRWLKYPPRESIRLFVLAVEALEAQGVVDPRNHVVLIRGLTTYTLLVKKDGFSEMELSSIREYTDLRRFDLVYLPGMNTSEANRFNRFPEPAYYETVQALLEPRKRNEFVRGYMFDVSAPSDDKPFFFNQFRFRKAKSLYAVMGEKWELFFEGGFTALVVFFQALAFSALFIVCPLWLKYVGLGSRFREWFRPLSYFLLIGLGFMLIEITFIQKFILPLGKPVYAISAVLGSILFFSGLGSLASVRIREEAKVGTILSGLALIVFFYAFILPNILYMMLGNPMIKRVIYSVLITAPLAFLMGFPFPLGIRCISKVSGKEILPWAWAVNGAASVFGAVLAVVFSTTLGYNATLISAAILYAAAAILATRRSSALLRP